MATVILEPFKLGDFIQSTALLRDLREADPGERLVIAVSRPEVAAACERASGSDSVVLVDEAGWRKGDCELIRKALGETENAPKIINLSSSPPSLKMAESRRGSKKPGASERVIASGIIGPRSEGGELILPGLQRLAMAFMATRRRLGTLNLVDIWRSLGPSPLTRKGSLYWPLSGSKDNAENDNEVLKDLSNCLKAASFGDNRLDGDIDANRQAPIVGLHLGCGHHLRRWPTERFAALAKILAPASLIVLGGPSEKALAKRFLALYEKISPGCPRPLNLAGRTSLDSLGLVLSELDLLVSADTSVMHMAAAVGAPVLAVFGGPAYAFETGPYSEKALIVQGLGPCSPCRDVDACPHGRCLALPGVAPVAKAALAMLGRKDAALEDPTEGGLAESALAESDLKMARLANGILASSGLAKTDPESTWTSQTFRTGLDPLGQILVPEGPAGPSIPGRLAKAARAAGARVLGLAEPENFGDLFQGWPEPEGGSNVSSEDVSLLEKVASIAFSENSERSLFVETAKELLAPRSDHQ